VGASAYDTAVPDREPTVQPHAPASTASIHTPTEDEERPHAVQSAEGEATRKPKISGWQRYARIVGLLILVVVTAYGIRQLMAGDVATVAAFWKSKIAILPAVLLFSMLNLALEVVGWAWVFSRLGLRANDSIAVSVCAAGKAGLLLPAQLGRLIRPDLMVRLGRGTIGDNLKAEGAVFVLDSLSVVALFAGLVSWRVHPALGPVAFATVVLVFLFLGNRITSILSRTRLEFPGDFWWSWQAFAIVVVEAAGWASYGIAFYVLTSDLPGDALPRTGIGDHRVCQWSARRPRPHRRPAQRLTRFQGSSRGVPRVRRGHVSAVDILAPPADRLVGSGVGREPNPREEPAARKRT
jgi:hypothetical protein